LTHSMTLTYSMVGHCSRWLQADPEGCCERLD
jgi:hypothetical protein